MRVEGALEEIILVRDLRSARTASTARLMPRRRSIGFMPCEGEGEGEGEGEAKVRGRGESEG